MFNTHVECMVSGDLCRRVVMLPDMPDLLLFLEHPPSQLMTFWTIKTNNNKHVLINIIQFKAAQRESCAGSQLALFKYHLPVHILVSFIMNNKFSIHNYLYSMNTNLILFTTELIFYNNVF